MGLLWIHPIFWGMMCGIYGGSGELKTGCDAVSDFRNISVILHSSGFMALGVLFLFIKPACPRKGGNVLCLRRLFAVVWGKALGIAGLVTL